MSDVARLTLLAAIDDFLLKKGVDANGVYINTNQNDGVYYPKIKAFYDYLLEKRNLKDDSWKDLLMEFKPKDIEESMVFYIDESRKHFNPAFWVRKKGTLHNYVTVVTEFFKYLSSIDHKNQKLLYTFDLWEEDDEQFNKIIEKVCEGKDLIEKVETQEPILDEDFRLLCDVCDNDINRLALNEKRLLEDDKYYNKYVRALIIKLLLFTGARYSVLTNITIKDFNVQCNVLKINNYTVHLPNKLCSQLQKYYLVRKNINSDFDNLFVFRNGKLSNGSNQITSPAFVVKFLIRHIGRDDIKGISKYTIIKMIKSNINQEIIQEFTQYKETIYYQCLGYVFKENDFLTKSRYLDSKIRSLDIFDYL
ncbi:hypothetical protein GTO91_14300 [Heliobacterium undosum]|uniref:Uncharacterized protein n=1 Tax=Heliomicrobium undosum TaxID=121734 RepID=A0A845L2S1_9FIRM|nr:site-specific integrase [Heliomicrobium undosum]MZP30887.1 hypothetical protein [Heliomicrobium undosum]